jgi:hypothetical protein
MSIQLPLPGNWPCNMTTHDPGAKLEGLERDKLAAKIAIYEALRHLATKQGIPLPEVNGVMLNYVNDALADLTSELEEALRRERDETPDTG